MRTGIIPARAGFTYWTWIPVRTHPDHPRSRGVYPATRLAGPAVVGSSPLARGLREDDYCAGAGGGIIPARAGFTVHIPLLIPGSRDHPRSRGVYGFGDGVLGDPVGSSPLARGLPGGPTGVGIHPRIIPARAGFTRAWPRGLSASRDHPRSRGVYPKDQVKLEKNKGSSPLARGLREYLTQGVRPHRIIPARAGFTAFALIAAAAEEDHPRSRGVYTCAIPDLAASEGSSPLARGLHARLVLRVESHRIIPARAGFTPHPPGARSPPPDHPRSRGVYPATRLAGPAVVGSSPLARGLHPFWEWFSGHCRIIPARAGFTPVLARGCGACGDHPRSRGVYRRRWRRRRRIIGSSPLARGLQLTGRPSYYE